MPQMPPPTQSADPGERARLGAYALIVRDGEVIVPMPRTVMRHGDELLIVTPRRMREKTEKRLTNISIHGRLARWTAELKD